MREYSKVSPRFWTGDTGRQLRKLGADVQVVAFYLFTCPHANMLGLYYLGLPTLCHETGRSLEGARKALRSLREAGFAYYDEASEHVYLPNMAREQIGDRLKSKDNRHVAVVRELEQLRKTPFFADFVTRYRDAFELHEVQLTEGLPRGLEGASEVLRSQEQEQEQEQEQNNKNGHQTVVPTDVDVVFDHWKQTHNHPRSQLDDKRRKIIRVALKTYPIEQLCAAIGGYKNSPFHMGKNERNTVYDDIEIFLKDGKHIDAGLKFAEQGRSEKWT